jgi:hypothetical protein
MVVPLRNVEKIGTTGTVDAEVELMLIGAGLEGVKPGEIF